MRHIATYLHRIFPAVALCAALGACTQTDRSGYADIPAAGWRYGDTLSFTPLEGDSVVRTGSLAVAVRHTNRYEYSNLWLELQYTGADTVHTDTLQLVLADTYGKWAGAGLGVSYQYVDTVLRDIEIDPAAPISLRHIMRVDTLAEIEQVGVFFCP